MARRLFGTVGQRPTLRRLFGNGGGSRVIPHDRLSEVFGRGLRDGLDTLAPNDRELFLIQDFIIEYEMNGLSGYFYNRLPDLERIREAVVSMRRHKLAELATILDTAAGLFAGYTDPDPPTTWSEVCRRYDPAGRLNELDRDIMALNSYGLGAA